ncbi:MAG: Glutathione-regulated potassium-efflux system protein KefC [Rhodocyclaceae bacterium]|nr:MAG: potassium transporter [Rhodocyclaceae bacterium]MBV6408585.1 Glutathione-regulated potassium-efflux system protein KefC [Rhodocyclaceae bacterium]CAG0931495.1 Glutathione-regulated potassium-efflux system protein KefC [Rhodocyclaceae bacterium]
MTTLQLVLVLLASAVFVVVLFRSLNLPPVLGYLLVGAAIGPHALDLVPDSAAAHHLAEFGVVFLMFSIGLEFSLPRLYSMKRTVFGLGLAQVAVTVAINVPVALLAGLSWQAGIALGGILAMSSTALLVKMLAERMQLESKHGREIIGVLLFQDLAVVPLLIVVPALSQSPEAMAGTLAVAAAKAAVVLALILFFGQRLMRGWFLIVARRRSAELFMLNVLLITLGLAYLTELAGLSLALGAFLAGMLISETEYRYQVEEDIKPFRDVLLGLFFITVGMFLDVVVVARELPWVAGLLALLLAGKFALVAGVSRAFGAAPGTAMRSGLWLCAGGEFGFVLIAHIRDLPLLPATALQVVTAALVLSMLLAPLIVQHSEKAVMRFCASEWMLRAMELTQIAARSLATEKHAIICGYGRSGQYLARFVAQEGVSYVALDLDPERVREAAAAGDTVVYGDAARREALVAAGLMRASAVIVSYADADSALRVLSVVRELRPELPVVVRAADESDFDRLSRAGAAEVVPEVLESSIMLASHALVLLGVPITRVVRRFREVREQRYDLMRGFFHGATDAADDPDEARQPRLHSVVLNPGAWGIGKTLAQLGLERFEITVSVIRRRGIRGVSPSPEARLEAGDVVVLLGVPDGLAAGEERLLKG